MSSTDGDSRGWGQGRLLVVAVAIIATAAVLVAGAGLAVYQLLDHDQVDPGSPTPRLGEPRSPGGSQGLGPRAEQQSAITQAPMAKTDADAMWPSDVRSSPEHLDDGAVPASQVVVLPAPTLLGPQGVPTGFPPSPAGAVAQLAALETVVLQRMDTAAAAAIGASWSLTPTPDQDQDNQDNQDDQDNQGNAGASSLVKQVSVFRRAAGLPVPVTSYDPTGLPDTAGRVAHTTTGGPAVPASGGSLDPSPAGSPGDPSAASPTTWSSASSLASGSSVPAEPGSATEGNLAADVGGYPVREPVQDTVGDAVVIAAPAAGLVKGTVGDDWTMACVLLEVQATYRETGRVAFGHCAAMQWSQGRWVLAPGPAPAAAPATWPGSAAARRAGWQPVDASSGSAAGGSAGFSTGTGTGSDTGSDGSTGGTGGTGAAVGGLSDRFAAWTPPAGSTAGTTDAGRVVSGSGDTAGPEGRGPAEALEIPNPLDELGGVVSGVAADAWSSAMLAVWGAGLLVLRVVLDFADGFLTPDLSGSGPGRRAYVSTFWIASVLVVVLAMVQLGAAAFRRSGQGIARVLVGAAQFVLVWSCWVGYCAVVVTACGALAHALMQAMLGVDSWQAWDPLTGIDTNDVSDAAVATVLGLLGCVLWVAALGHLLVMLARAASLVVLVATGPISAAGLVSDTGRAWFWKSLRWFHAAALTPVLMVLVLGIGVQISTGVAAGDTTSASAAVGTALPSVLLLCVACTSPLALFKLLAFSDPGTPSGASFRQGMAAQGGLQGLMTGRSGSASQSESLAAAETDQHGRSSGERGAESAAAARFAGPAAAIGFGAPGGSSGSGGASKPGGAGGLAGLGKVGGLAGLAGGVGQGVAAAIGVMQKAGTLGTSLLSDESNQSGVGHQTHSPDFTSLRTVSGPSPMTGRPRGGRDDDGPAPGGASGGPGGPGGPGGLGGDGGGEPGGFPLPGFDPTSGSPAPAPWSNASGRGGSGASATAEVPPVSPVPP